MVPVRFISEGLGAEVGWDGAIKTVTISMDSIEYLKSEINMNNELIKEKDEKIEKLSNINIIKNEN